MQSVVLVLVDELVVGTSVTIVVVASGEIVADSVVVGTVADVVVISRGISGVVGMIGGTIGGIGGSVGKISDSNKRI